MPTVNENLDLLTDYGFLSYSIGAIDGADGVSVTRMDLVGLSREQVREKREAVKVLLREMLGGIQ